jgi:hypothetical protein
MTMRANWLESRLTLVAALCLLGAGCRETYVNADTNRLPVAVPRAVDASGMSVDSSANHGLGPIYPFAGKPVEVVLDGTASTDTDGSIVSYHWLSATRPDGGAGRKVPDGESQEWPDDVAMPHVKLGEGKWSFSLWVTDDDGAISDPEVIELIVGDAPEVDAGPAAVMCMGKVCDPKVTLPGASEPSVGCCDMDNGGACGAVVDTMGACEAVDQPGNDDPSCPSEMSVAGTMIAGCCTPSKKCGVRSGVLRGCIERSDYPPAFLMSMMQLEAADCASR